MEVNDVIFKRYTPSEGKALKIHRRNQNIDGTTHEWLSYSLVSVIATDEDLASPIEEVDAKEFQEWNSKRSMDCGVGILTK